MDRRRTLERAGDPPITYVEARPVTQEERRAAATNKREYDRETGIVPDREQSREEHENQLKKGRPSGRPDSN